VGGKKSPKDEPNVVTPHGGSQGWLLSAMSSKWLILFVLLLAGIVWFGFYATHTKEIAGSDDRGYAEIARNIVNGKGIVRNFMYPVDINFFKRLPVPEFVHPPGYPLILAGFFKLFGISDFVALLPSYLAYFVLSIFLFYFVKRFVDVRTAVMAAVIFIFNKEILDASLVALSEAVYMLMFFLFFVFMIKAKSLKGIFIAGILLGVSHLLRENIYPFLVPLFVYLYFFPDLPRWKRMAFFIVGFLIPLIPNILRSFFDTGSFFFSYGKFTLMAYTVKYPWLNIYRDIQNPSLFEFLMETPGQFFWKYVSNVVNALEQFVSISNPYVSVFFILEMFHWKISAEWKRIKMLFLFLLISQILFIALFTFTTRFFVPLLPMIIVFASQSFGRVLENLISCVRPHWREKVLYLSVFLFLILFITPTAYTIFQPNKPEELGFKTPQFGFLIPKREAMRLGDFLRSEFRPDQVVWTDLPEVLEWEGDRLSGWLPTEIKAIYEIHKKIPVDAILLTSVRTPYKMEEEWKYLLFSEHSLPGYRNVKLYKSGTVFAKLLIRDEAE
jgi:4-amino-4-deoxy-L-arabinose transferase-like glycosyltransferase